MDCEESLSEAIEGVFSPVEALSARWWYKLSARHLKTP